MSQTALNPITAVDVLITGGPRSEHVCLLILWTQFLQAPSKLELDIQVARDTHTVSIRHWSGQKRKKITIKCRQKVTDECITYYKVIFKLQP